jgi:hypothetical protein
MNLNHSRILAWLLSIIIFIIKSKTNALKEKDPECSDNLISYLNKQLSLANKYYTEVKRQDRELYFARAGIALIHKEKAYISRQVYNDRQKAKSSIYCAIRELRHAKYIAESRNDKNNLRWLNSNLQDLERQLHVGKGSRLSRSHFPIESIWILALREDCHESEELSDDNSFQNPLAQQALR